MVTNVRQANRVGETRIMNNGEKVTIIAYRTNKDLDVQFEDGYIRTKVRYVHFRNGQLTRITKEKMKTSEEKVGETNIMNNGMKATIIGFIKGNSSIKRKAKVKIRFENGIEKYTQYEMFKAGTVSDKAASDQKSRVGIKIMQNCGLEGTVIEYKKQHDFTVQFEDGTIAKAHRWGMFKDGNILHPLFHNQSVFKYGDLECQKKFRTTNEVYYLVRSLKDNFEGLMTAKEILCYGK